METFWEVNWDDISPIIFLYAARCSFELIAGPSTTCWGCTFSLTVCLGAFTASSKISGVEVNESSVLSKVIPFEFWASALDLFTVDEKGTFSILNENPL